MPAVPEKGLHANRSHSVPTDDGPKNCFSRTDILTDKTPAAFGSGQSMSVCVDGETRSDPDTWPKNWYIKGRVLRVPRTAVLSSFPFWTLYWPNCYFFMPRDVVGDNGYGGLSNYYYLEQWNGIDMNTGDDAPDYSFVQGYDVSDPAVNQALLASSGYANNRVWNNMVYLDPADKQTVYNAYASCMMLSEDGGAECASIPAYMFNNCPTPPMDERYYKMVGSVTNPYYQVHPKLLDAFIAAKAILEGDKKDPIFVAIPDWLPRQLHQLRNAYLKMTHEKKNPAHGGSANKRPCEVADTQPCWIDEPMCWAPPYPNKDDPRNNPGFDCPQVPWMLSAEPGFGTNTLHLYVGHPNMSYFPTQNFYDFQAWPLTPEEQWIAGPVGQTSYLGDPRPYYAGRHPSGGVFGYDYGYVNHGAQGLWDNVYSGIVGGAAGNYQSNFWKFRNLGTRIFTYDVQWDFQWDFQKLYDDRRNDCPATQFYTGYSFADFANMYDNEDNNIIDCSSYDHLAVGETQNYTPSRASIDEAVGIGVRLTQRVLDYYNNNDAGAADFFRIAIEQTGMANYNCSYEGSMPGEFLDPDGIVSYVREYFKDHK